MTPSPDSSARGSEAATSLDRLPSVLGPVTAATIVVGGVIGSGIFFKPKEIVESVGGHFGLIITLWIVCGLVNLCGALSLSELSTMMPHAGGMYVYLREAYGRACSFVWVWAEFWVIRSGAMASLAVAATMSVEPLLAAAGYAPTAGQWRWLQKGIAAATIAILAVLNIVGTRVGGGTQNLLTAVKVAFLIVLAGLPFMAAGSEPLSLTPYWPSTVKTWLPIGTALAAVMWAYDGWGNLTVVAEEVRNPQRNIPRAMVGGLVVLIVLYCGATLAFHLTLRPDEIKAAAVPAVAVTGRLLGPAGETLMLSMLIVSVVGALNQNILTGPRVLYALGRDFSEFRIFRHVDPRTATPSVAIAALSAWAVMLVMLGDLGGHLQKSLFDILTVYCIFGGSIFYLLAVVAVFVLRRRNPETPRPYRTWGYPAVPAVFVAFYVLFLAGMLVDAPRESLTGLSLIVSGAVVYRIVAVVKRARGMTQP